MLETPSCGRRNRLGLPLHLEVKDGSERSLAPTRDDPRRPHRRAFADGVLRALGADGYGSLARQARPLSGRISMDLIALDVTDCKQALVGVRAGWLEFSMSVDRVIRRASGPSGEAVNRLVLRAAPGLDAGE